MTKKKSLLSVFLPILLLLSLTGCWSAQEINNLAIINIIGVDEDNSGDVVLTVSVIRPNMLFAQGSDLQGPKKESFVIHSASGKNLFDAMGKLSKSIPEKIFLGHANVVVFGKKAAENQMETAIDFFKRQNDFRPSIELFVTKGNASDLIKQTPVLNPTLATELHDLALRNRFSATNMVKDISQFTNALTSDTVDPYTGVISLSAMEHGNSTKDSSSKKAEKNTIEPQVLTLNETAVFKGASLKGFLNDDETKGLLWLLGDLNHENLILDCGSTNKEGTVGLNVTNSSSTMVPTFPNGQPKMTVTIQTQADLVEVTCKNFTIDTVQMDKLNKQFEAKIRDEALSALSIAQQNWETDIFGFGKAIYRKYPEKWDQIAQGWRSGGLRNMNVDVNVSATIDRYGLLKTPSKANESR
ncbi:Ger(x)C family spore germination protein [Neobacillus cucumis]|uniref:Ger(x)C family spore germination protein n=1 Tax=Neobacillus cucumis TaxID=1740721 RepID=UPI0018DF01DD|nr:Ger(x)C family spore germination protein [Neobacillus cucumis]MBI0579583.1 Ger(x)C family spore germination protein [Neobacillus cucumis]